MDLTLSKVNVVMSDGSIQFKNYDEIKQMVETVLDEYRFLKLNEENKQVIKKARAELNALVNTLETERKKTKKSFMNPLDLFETQVKEITTLISSVSGQLGDMVSQQEESVKKEKETVLMQYFYDLALSNDIDFLKFEDVGLNITLTTTEKKLKEEINEFIDKVNLDLIEIESDVNQVRLLAKYKISKDLQKSRIELNNELKMETNVKIEEKPQEIQNKIVEEIMTVSFTVTAPKSKLLKLKNYMKEDGIFYE